ncbi:MAG: DUF5995 family protein [Bacteroidota bacterium]
MKYLFVILFSIFLCTSGHSQPQSYSFYQLYQLDSIGKSNSFTRHFGSLYFDFLQLVEKKLRSADAATQRLVRNFESVFAQFYIDACTAYQRHETIPLAAWRPYFRDSSLRFFQYYLLGANAHLNGGLAEAIARSYTPAEWISLKNKYSLFNKCLNETFKKVHTATMENSKRARGLSILTLGLERPVGQYYLYKWRKRQMRLTENFYTHPDRYKKLTEKIDRKKQKIDWLVFTQF